MDICNYLQEENVFYILHKYRLNKRINHLKRVTDYSEILISLLADKFGFNDSDKNMLKYCSLLHDIGYSINKVDHHKHSKYIILNDTIFDGLPKELRNFLAVVVASHRRKIDKDIDIYTLNEKIRVLRLISLLRLADGLDYSGDNILLDAYITDNSLYLKLLAAPVGKDLEKINRKAELFRESFNLNINIEL